MLYVNSSPRRLLDVVCELNLGSQFPVVTPYWLSKAWPLHKDYCTTLQYSFRSSAIECIDDVGENAAYATAWCVTRCLFAMKSPSRQILPTSSCCFSAPLRGLGELNYPWGIMRLCYDFLMFLPSVSFNNAVRSMLPPLIPFELGIDWA